MQLILAVENEDWHEAEQLLQAQDCDVNARTRDFGHALLQAAAGHGALKICQLLVAQGADVNAVDGSRTTPLMSCVIGGDHGEIICMLLDARANLSIETYDGCTALGLAERYCRTEAICVLGAADKCNTSRTIATHQPNNSVSSAVGALTNTRRSQGGTSGTPREQAANMTQHTCWSYWHDRVFGTRRNQSRAALLSAGDLD